MSCQPLLPIHSPSQSLEISKGMEKERVPWTELERAREDYIKPKYLPKKVTLKQYYHLCQKDVNAMLEHWMSRQAASKVPFCFRKVAKAIRRNKHALEENNADADSDTGPGEESKDDLQGDDVSQAWGDAAENGQGGAQPSEAANAYALQQTGGDLALDLPHTCSTGQEPSFNDEVSYLDHLIGH